MGTDPQKRDPKQSYTIEELSNRVCELEEEKIRVSKCHQDLESRMGKLESTMKDVANQLSAASPANTPQAVDWLSAYSKSEQAELQKKKEELDIIVTRLTS